jgi:hypothetical protein
VVKLLAIMVSSAPAAVVVPVVAVVLVAAEVTGVAVIALMVAP